MNETYEEERCVGCDHRESDHATGEQIRDTGDILGARCLAPGCVCGNGAPTTPERK